MRGRKTEALKAEHTPRQRRVGYAIHNLYGHINCVLHTLCDILFAYEIPFFLPLYVQCAPAQMTERTYVHTYIYPENRSRFILPRANALGNKMCVLLIGRDVTRSEHRPSSLLSVKGRAITIYRRRPGIGAILASIPVLLRATSSHVMRRLSRVTSRPVSNTE